MWAVGRTACFTVVVIYVPVNFLRSQIWSELSTCQQSGLRVCGWSGWCCWGPHTVWAPVLYWMLIALFFTVWFKVISKLCWKCVNEGDLCEKQKHPFNSAVTLEFWSWRAAAPWTSSQTSSSTLLRLLGLSLQAWDLVFSNLNRRMLCPELQSKAQTPVAPVSPSTRPPWGFVYDFQPVCGMPLVFKCALEDSAANLLPSSQRRIFLIGLCVWVSGFFIINLCLKAYMLKCKSVILWFL